MNYAIFLQKLQRFERAEETFRKVLDQDPQTYEHLPEPYIPTQTKADNRRVFLNAAFGLASLLHKTKSDFSGACDALERSFEFDPACARNVALLGDMSLMKGDLPRALVVFEHLSELMADEGAHTLNRSDSFELSLEQRASALVNHAKTLADYELSTTEQKERSIKLSRQALALLEGHSELATLKKVALCNAAILLKEMGRKWEALTMLK